jgi:hypothetical protein
MARAQVMSIVIKGWRTTIQCTTIASIERAEIASAKFASVTLANTTAAIASADILPIQFIGLAQSCKSLFQSDRKTAQIRLQGSLRRLAFVLSAVDSERSLYKLLSGAGLH